MISAEVERLRAAREPFVHATVVRAVRPTSVRPGDTALVLGDETTEGFVGGTCAQTSVRLHAARALERDEGVLLDRRAGEVADVPVAGRITREVETRDDDHAVLAAEGAA